jgi:2-methylcitrate dehydratase
MSDRFSRTFAVYAAETTWGRLPAETVREVQRRVLDSIGVAIAGLDESAPVAARRYAQGHPGAATVWGSRVRADAEAAGFANGVAVRALDFNDTYLSLEPLHPSDAIAALLALAEVRSSTGRELIRAIAVSYEVSVSLCDAASLRAHGWDHVAFLGIGTACGAGALLGLPADRIEHAISLAAVPHAPMRQTRAGELSMWKGAAAANAARHAVFGALLAEAGMTGPLEPFEGEMGFVRQMLDGEGFDEEALKRLEALEPPTRISDTYVKAWPVEYHAQSAVDAALRIHARLAGRGIASVRIDTFRASYDIIAKDAEKWDPGTRETADHSLQYIVCAALQDGEVTAGTFDPARFRRPDTLELLQRRTTVEPDDELTAGYPEGIPNRVTVAASDGEAFVERVDHPRGHARNPMADEELVAKYLANVGDRWPPERSHRVVATTIGLHEDGGLERLVQELGP